MIIIIYSSINEKIQGKKVMVIGLFGYYRELSLCFTIVK